MAEIRTANTPPIPADTYRLRLPGPIAVPERVRAAIARPVVSHRGPVSIGLATGIGGLVLFAVLLGAFFR